MIYNLCCFSLRKWRKSPYLLDAFLSRLTFMNIIHTAFADGSWPIIIWDFSEAKIWITQTSRLLEVGLAGQLCITMWYCLSIPVWSCSVSTWIYDTHLSAIKKMNSYNTEIREMYFQPKMLLFSRKLCIVFDWCFILFSVTHCGGLQ